MKKKTSPKEISTSSMVIEETPFKKYIPKIAALLLILLLVAGIFTVVRYKKVNMRSTTQQDTAKKDITELIVKVGALIELPTGEAPTVATVADKTKLRDQPFFAKTENGDRVIIYTNAKKAILYRPSTNKIIEVTTLNIADTSPSPAQEGSGITVSPTPDLLPQVVIYNATTKSGYANATEKQLKELLPIEVIKKANTTVDVDTILVVDLSGKTPEAAAQIAQNLGGKVSPLPKSVERPEGDILVILGK